MKWQCTPLYERDTTLLPRIRTLIEAGESDLAICRILGIGPCQLTRWRNAGVDIPPSNGRGSKGPKNYFWKKGWTTTKGYRQVWIAGRGYVLEHRLAMERTLGRPLMDSEVVHHIDGDPSNNAVENLAVYDSNSDHLSDTLRGYRPNWTPDGLRRMRIGVLRGSLRRSPSNPRREEWLQEICDLQSLGTLPLDAEFDTAWLRPLGTRRRAASR